MTYLSDKKRNQKKYYYYVIVFFIVLSIIYMWPSFRVRVYPYFENTLISYFYTKSNFSNIVLSIHTYFISRTDLENRNASLSVTIERLENELAEKEATIKENSSIYESKSSGESSTLILYPIMQDITHLYSTIIFSKGFKDGVEEQKIVYIRGRQAVCAITEVYDKTSLCTLFSASSQKLDGVASSTTLFLQGGGGGTFVAEVEKDADISVGEVVYLKSNQTFSLGKVTKIIRDDQLSSWYVYVQGAYNPVTSNIFYINK